MEELLNIRELRVEFRQEGEKQVRALNGVNLTIGAGETIGLLGESGSGKSTLAKTLLRLLPDSAEVSQGNVTFEGRDLLALSGRELERTRGARIALIPQEPGMALSPFLKVGKQIAEVVQAHNDWKWKRCCEEAEELLRQMKLGEAERRLFDAYPHQLSGGQQQRVAIAQAISCGPALVVADEPTSALDSDTEEDIVKLLKELRASRKMALLFITHNTRILRGAVERVAVMYAGRVVEEGTTEQILRQPQHPYAKALVKCVPPETSDGKRARGGRFPFIPGNSAPADAEMPGCSFAPRCSERLQHCDERRPAAVAVKDAGRVECFLYGR